MARDCAMVGRARRVVRIGRDCRGAALLEFAFAVPVLLTMVIGAAQLGLLFYANAGLKHAVGEGARYATIFPKPTNTQIIDRIKAQQYGLDPAYYTDPTVVDCVANSRPCLDITMRYSAPFNFIFFQTPAVTLVERRRVFPQQ